MATSQAVVILALAGLCGVPYSPVLMLKLLASLFLASMSITAFDLLLVVLAALGLVTFAVAVHRFSKTD